MEHVSSALLHLVISLAASISPVTEEGDYGGETIFRALELSRVAPNLAKRIHSLLHQVRAIMEALEGGTIDRNTINVQIHQIFNALCGEYPGALNIRQSYRTFRESFLQKPARHELPYLRFRTPFETSSPVVHYGEPDILKVAHVLASIGLIEKAFSELEEDSIWLTENHKYSSADFSPLASPSLDDAILKTVRRHWRAWAKDEAPLDLLVEKALRALLPAYKQVQSTMRTFEADSVSLPADLSVTVTKICDVFATMDNVNKIGKPIRVAVVGPPASGKTTFINSLIGQNLLISGGHVPILIQHVNGLDEPILKINLSQFLGYFYHIEAFMKKVYARQQSQEKLKFEYIVRRGLIKEREQMNLQRVQGGGWSLLEQYKGLEAVIEAQQALNDLVKLYAILTMGERPAIHSPPQWPVLQVHMTEMSILSEAFEIIELPAADAPDYHYRDISLLEQIHQDALLDVDGVIAVIPLLDSMSSRHSLQCLSLGRLNLLPEIAPLLLVLGTKTDLQRTWSWSEQSKQGLTQRIFHDKESPRLITQASPFIHIGTQHAISFVTSIAEGLTPRSSLRKLKLEDPKTCETLDILLGLQGKEPAWQSIPIGRVLRTLEEAMESSGYAELRWKLDEYVSKATKQRRLLLGISALGSLVDQLQQALALAIRKVPNSSVCLLPGPRVIVFPDIVRDVRSEWMTFIKKLEINLAQTVRYTVADAEDKARFHLNAICNGYFDRLGTRKYVLVPTMDDAINLFLEVEKEVKKLVHALQSDVVDTIRNNLRKASVSALQELATMLKARNESESYHLMQVLMHRLTSLSVNSTPSQAENPMDTSSENLSDTFVAQQMSVLGFLLRPPVEKSTPSELRRQSWFPTASSYPARLDRQEVERYFLDTTIDPWSEQIHREGRSAVERALGSVISSGERCLGEFLTALEAEKIQLAEEMPQATQHAMTLLRINVISSRELLRILHRRLYVEIGRPDPLSHAGLPAFLGETDEGIDRVPSESADWLKHSMRNVAF